MILQIVLIFLGVVLIVAGAHFLTEGASGVATRFRIPQLVIGLTVVAFGTSTPELTVSVLGSLAHNGGIAVGNVIGSNIFNGLAILGITALITPLAVERNLNRFDIPISIFAAIALALVISDRWIDGMPSTIYRSEAILLVIFGLIFLSYTVYIGRQGAREQTINNINNKEYPTGRRTVVDVLFTLLGLGALVFGGNLFVNNASLIASTLGVSDTLIGLTLVSWGTSLPELATSVVAALKRNASIAVGNVVGSNIFNVFFVLGISGVVNPLTNLQFTELDVIMQLLTSIVIFAVALYFGQRKITRAEGTGMLTLFVIYNIYIISQAL